MEFSPKAVRGLVLAAAVWGCEDGAEVTSADGGAVADTPAGMDGALSPEGAVTVTEAGTGLPDGPFRLLDGQVSLREDGGFTWTCTPTTCANHLLECGDCVDNDGDGRIDARDPECLGPCDNTEGPVLLAGVGGERGGPCQSDCYFDFGNGAGNDDCRWSHRCDPLEIPPNYSPEGMRCAYDRSRVGGRDCPVPQSPRCISSCAPITPNGCDCFGCCTFPELAGRGPMGTAGYVWLGSRSPDGAGSCSLAEITNPDACRACTPVPSCLNTCEPCEVCLGRPAPAPGCAAPPPDAGTMDVARPSDAPGVTRDAASPPSGQCAAGLLPCGLPGQPTCPLNFYCITGCCIASPQ